MDAVKNIIFDLGGVLLDIDYNKTSDAFKKLGASDFDSFYSQQGANQLFEDLETGELRWVPPPSPAQQSRAAERPHAFLIGRTSSRKDERRKHEKDQ